MAQEDGQTKKSVILKSIEAGIGEVDGRRVVGITMNGTTYAVSKRDTVKVITAITMALLTLEQEESGNHDAAN